MTEKKYQNEKPLTAHDAAAYLNYSLSHLYKLTHLRKIPFHKPNGRVLFFYASELECWIKQNNKQNW